MLTAINGIFRNGRIELEEDPGIVGESPVVVTFLKQDLSQAKTQESKMISFGMLAEPDRRMSDEEDFRIAEHKEKPCYLGVTGCTRWTPSP